MPDDLGNDSRDMRTLGIPNPAEQHLTPDDRETQVQRRGRRQYRAGLGILTAAPFTALALALATDGPTFHNLVSACFGLLGLVSMVALGTILTAVGAGEREQRPQRAMMRQLLRTTDGQAAQIRHIEHAITAIAAHIPQMKDARFWEGFNSAVVRLEQTSSGETAEPRRQPRPRLVRGDER